MKARLTFAVAVAALLASPVAAAPTPIVVSATPTQVTLSDHAEATLTVLNPGRQAIVVNVTRGDYEISRLGKAVVDPKLRPSRSAKGWIDVSPARLVVAPNGRGEVHVASHPPQQATPGDHHALVLLTASQPGSGQVSIRMRLGVVVLVRVTGPLVRKLDIGRLGVAKTKNTRVLNVGLTNAGNVNERLLQGQVTIALRRGGKTMAVVRAPARTLLPGDTDTVAVPYRGTLRGTFTAVVHVTPTAAALAGPGAPALEPLERIFTVRL